MMLLEMGGKHQVMKAKKSLGQNFLQNDTIIKKIVSLFVCKENDLIIEIGSGRGALTKYLISLPCQFLGIEIDKDMHSYLDSLKTNIIYDDILKIDLETLLKNYHYDNLYIVGNLPYYITSPIITKLIQSNLKIKKMVFMVQKEVAERFTSKSGSKDYGYMTVFINHYYETKYEFTVLKDEFKPVPKVDSAIISLKEKEYKEVPKDYWDFVKEAFFYKRKNLKNNLSKYNLQQMEEVLKDYNLDLKVRAEDLPEDILYKLYISVKDK